MPRLAAHARLRADPLNQRPLLLYPEGVLELEETAAAVLALCDGRRSLREISTRLAEEYEAPLDEITADAIAYLRELESQGMVHLEGPRHGA